MCIGPRIKISKIIQYLALVMNSFWYMDWNGWTNKHNMCYLWPLSLSGLMVKNNHHKIGIYCNLWILALMPSNPNFTKFKWISHNQTLYNSCFKTSEKYAIIYNFFLMKGVSELHKSNIQIIHKQALADIQT